MSKPAGPGQQTPLPVTLPNVAQLEALAPEANQPDPTPPAHKQHHAHKPMPLVMMAAIGVVFGDIGTSPLYSLQTVFTTNNAIVAPTATNVFGVISLVFWSILIVVTLKYVVFVMRADNDGEGGILALTALLRRTVRGKGMLAMVTLLGVVGAALFYGDSLITPAISVMSAIEGLEVVAHDATRFVVPVAVVILTMLFAIQRFGTGFVGRAFGPIMVLWFLTIAALGIPQIVQHPGVLKGLSPHYAVAFWVQEPGIAFVAMGAVVLCITGAEALYADMGHFGARPIRLAWLYVVFPCVTLNYLGQASLILHHPEDVINPFFEMAPRALLIPIVVLATMATVIASQSVISGAFSVTNQALHLGLLPRLRVLHTSKVEGGQIVVPAVNFALLIGVIALVVGMKSSENLAHAYGLAVTGTLVLTTILFLGVARQQWKWPIWLLIVMMVVIGGFEAVYLGANITKIVHGGWLPILIAVVVVTVMTTWMWGSKLVTERRIELEGNLDTWLEKVRNHGIQRVPGQAIYLHANATTVPLALKETLRFHKVLPERVAIVSVQVLNVPHVRHVDRVVLTDVGTPDDGIVHLDIRLGFNDSTDVPHNMKWAPSNDEFEFNAEDVRYYFSMLDLVPAEHGGVLRRLRTKIFILMGRNASSRMAAFHLPPDRTAVIGGQLYL